jgi:hypothetical protein
MVDGVRFEVQPKKMTSESKIEATSMVRYMNLSEAREAKSFIFNGDFFESENPTIKTADCFILLKNETFGKIKKVVVIDDEVFLIIEQSYKILRRMSLTYQYIQLEKEETRYVSKKVHQIYKKVLFINEPPTACAFPNKIECD